MFEKNIYVKQSEIKASYKQDKNVGFLIGELTINSTLKNYKTVLNEAFKISTDKIKELNHLIDDDDKKEKNNKPPKNKKDKPTQTNIVNS